MSAPLPTPGDIARNLGLGCDGMPGDTGWLRQGRSGAKDGARATYDAVRAALLAELDAIDAGHDDPDGPGPVARLRAFAARLGGAS